jgi:iron(III) transport system permease protein
MRPPRTLLLTTCGLFGVISLLPIFYMFLAPLWSAAADSFNTHPLMESRHLALVRNSIGLAGGVAFCCAILGTVYAFLVTRTDLFGKKTFAGLFIAPILIPPYIHAIVWTHLDPFLKSIFHLDIHSLGGCIFVLTLAYFPFVVLTSAAGLQTVDRRKEEAALLGSEVFPMLRRITLPLAAPHIFAGVTFVFIFSIIDVGVPDILRVNVYPLEIFIQFSAFYDEWAATILSAPLVSLTLILILIQKWHMKGRSYVQIGGGRQPPIQFHLGIWQGLSVGFCFFILSVSFGVPIGVLLIKAGGISSYIRVISTSVGQIGYSLILALMGAFLTVALGVCMGYLIERLKGWKGLTISLLAVVPLAVPATTLGIGLIGVWNRSLTDVIYGSSIIVLIAYIARFIPYASLVAAAGISQVSIKLEEAALLAGSSWQRILLRILFPLTKRHLMAGFFIVFILAFGDLSTTLLVMPPGRETIPIKIYNLMHYGADNLVAALCVILIGLIFILACSFFLIHRKINTKILKIEENPNL